MKVGDKIRMKAAPSIEGRLEVLWQDGTYDIVWGDGSKSEHSDLAGLEPAPAVEPDRALRFNEGKAQLFYVDMFPDALREVARTLMYGTQREVKPYPKFNWTKGAPYTELYDCARRHMQDWLGGAKNDRDAEKQKWEVHNLAFAVGNLLRLLQQDLDGRTDLDDRGYRQGKGPVDGEQGR